MTIKLKEFEESDFEQMSPDPLILGEVPDHAISCLSLARQKGCDYRFKESYYISLAYKPVDCVYLYYVPQLNVVSCTFMCQPLFYGTFYSIDEIMIAFERSMKLYVKGFKLNKVNELFNHIQQE